MYFVRLHDNVSPEEEGRGVEGGEEGVVNEEEGWDGWLWAIWVRQGMLISRRVGFVGDSTHINCQDVS